MSANVVSSADNVVARASYASRLLSEDGCLLPEHVIKKSEVKSFEQKIMMDATALTLDSAESLMQGVAYCAEVTAAALRTVGALRTLPGAHFLFQRSRMKFGQRLVPGFAPLKDRPQHDFKHFEDLVKDDTYVHPVFTFKGKVQAWAVRKQATPSTCVPCSSLLACVSLFPYELHACGSLTLSVMMNFFFAFNTRY
jgi:hypothetical protein